MKKIIFSFLLILSGIIQSQTLIKLNQLQKSSPVGSGSVIVTDGTGTPTYSTVAAIGGSFVPYTGAVQSVSLGAWNGYANNFASRSTNVTSSASTTSLTVLSTRMQQLSGATTHTFNLPDATTLFVGFTFEFNNNSTGVLAVNDNGGNLITTVPAGGYTRVFPISVSTVNGGWDKHFLIPANGVYGTSGLAVTGTITADNFKNVYINGLTNMAWLGDSFTSADIFPVAVTTSLNASGIIYKEVNYGVSGNTTTQMVARFNAIKQGDYKYVIIEGGINDISGGVAVATITNNLQSMVTQAHNMGAKVIMLTTTPFKGNVNWSAGNQTIQDAVNTYILGPPTNVDFAISTYSLLNVLGTNSIQPGYDSGDHLHPNTAGYNVIATAIYTTIGASNWTNTVTNPTLTLGHTTSLQQDLNPLNRPAFKGMYLNDSLICGSNPIGSGNITSTGNLSGVSILASNNSTFTGVVYGLTDFEVGAAGVGGSFGTGGGALKVLAGSSSSLVTIATPSFVNGFLSVFNTGVVVVGDKSAVTTNTTGQIFQASTINTNTVAIIGAAPTVSLVATTSANSNLSFCSSNGTQRGLIDINISSSEMKFWGMSGGYFPTFGANGSERMRIGINGNVAIGNTVTTTATLNVTGTFSTSSTATVAGNAIASTTISGAVLPTSLSGSATLDFASTLAGTVTDMTLTVTGASDGDPCDVGVPSGSMPTTGTFEAFVSATNVVTIRYANNSLTLTQDPASGTFKVKVFKN